MKSYTKQEYEAAMKVVENLYDQIEKIQFEIFSKVQVNHCAGSYPVEDMRNYIAHCLKDRPLPDGKDVHYPQIQINPKDLSQMEVLYP